MVDDCRKNWCGGINSYHINDYRARGDDYDAYDVEETEDALQRAQEAERQAIDNVDSDDILFSAPQLVN